MHFGRLSRDGGTTASAWVGRASLAILLCTALAACGGTANTRLGSRPGSTDPTAVVRTGDVVRLHGMWPLTGHKLNGNLPHHPVYVVKVDNSASSAPQVGLRSADFITEELVEGGSTRLACFFYSKLPPVVGPVRSMRASDVGIVKPVNSVLVASGGAHPTIRRIAGAHIKALTEGASGFYRDSGRSAPYNLFMRTSGLRPGRWRSPVQTYFDFGRGPDFPGHVKVHRMSVTFSGSQTTDWSFSPKGWTRPNSHASPGDDFVAQNVVVIRVNVGNAGYLDPAGNPVPESVFKGSGLATLVVGDKALNVTWHKQTFGSKVRFTKNGKRVTLPAGRTWLELIPKTGGSLRLQK